MVTANNAVRELPRYGRIGDDNDHGYASRTVGANRSPRMIVSQTTVDFTRNAAARFNLDMNNHKQKEKVVVNIGEQMGRTKRNRGVGVFAGPTIGNEDEVNKMTEGDRERERGAEGRIWTFRGRADRRHDCL